MTKPKSKSKRATKGTPDISLAKSIGQQLGKTFKSHGKAMWEQQPSLNAIYRQQLLLRDAVKALTAVLTETQARCEKLQFDRGMLIEKVRQYRGLVLREPLPTLADAVREAGAHIAGVASTLKAKAVVPTLTERDADLAAVQKIIDQLGEEQPWQQQWRNGAVLAYNAIMALKPITATEVARCNRQYGPGGRDELVSVGQIAESVDFRRQS